MSPGAIKKCYAKKNWWPITKEPWSTVVHSFDFVSSCLNNSITAIYLVIIFGFAYLSDSNRMVDRGRGLWTKNSFYTHIALNFSLSYTLTYRFDPDSDRCWKFTVVANCGFILIPKILRPFDTVHRTKISGSASNR